MPVFGNYQAVSSGQIELWKLRPGLPAVLNTKRERFKVQKLHVRADEFDARYPFKFPQIDQFLRDAGHSPDSGDLIVTGQADVGFRCCFVVDITRPLNKLLYRMPHCVTDHRMFVDIGLLHL